MIWIAAFVILASVALLLDEISMSRLHEYQKPWTLENYQQAISRMHRPVQGKTVLNYYIQGAVSDAEVQRLIKEYREVYGNKLLNIER